MSNWHEELQKKLDYYTHIREQISSQLETAPVGKLLVSHCRKKYVQFYCYEEGNHNAGHKGNFISGKNADLIKGLAQKDYNQRLLCQLEKQDKVISDFLEAYDDHFVPGVFTSLKPEVQKLVDMDYQYGEKQKKAAESP